MSKSGEQTEPPREIKPSTSSPHGKETQTRHPENKRDQEKNPGAKEVAIEEPPRADELQYKRDYEKRQIDIQQAIADYTWALVAIGGIVGFFQIVVMILTYCVTGKAASAAKESADTARQSLTISERAWVRIDFHQLYEPGMLSIDLEIINTGKSPGHVKDVRVIALDIADAKQPIQWEPDPIPLDKRDTLWTIFPGQSTTQKYDQPSGLESAAIWEVIQGTKRLTIYGFILYDDIFGNRRTTRFYRVFMQTQSDGTGRFMIPPDALPGQNEAT